jgi:RsmE family RNA methyltransferase
MHRFFVEPEMIENDRVEIKGSDVKHIRDVLRFKPGDSIIVVDGSSAEYKAVIKSIEKDRVVCDVNEKNMKKIYSFYELVKLSMDPKIVSLVKSVVVHSFNFEKAAVNLSSNIMKISAAITYSLLNGDFSKSPYYFDFNITNTSKCSE